jgi:hypothetical protein
MGALGMFRRILPIEYKHARAANKPEPAEELNP